LELPEWYVVVRAARYLHVAPWELEEQHALYMYQALEAESAEATAKNELERRAERKRSRGSKTKPM
jgi:hypothetical protein